MLTQSQLPVTVRTLINLTLAEALTKPAESLGANGTVIIRNRKAECFLELLGANAAPDMLCDECGEHMRKECPDEDVHSLEPTCVATFTSEGFVALFLCDWCAEHYQDSDGQQSPNITRKLEALGGLTETEIRSRYLVRWIALPILEAGYLPIVAILTNSTGALQNA